MTVDDAFALLDQARAVGSDRKLRLLAVAALRAAKFDLGNETWGSVIDLAEQAAPGTPTAEVVNAFGARIPTWPPVWQAVHLLLEVPPAHAAETAFNWVLYGRSTFTGHAILGGPDTRSR